MPTTRQQSRRVTRSLRRSFISTPAGWASSHGARAPASKKKAESVKSQRPIDRPVGLPEDGEWNVVAAYDKRHCSDHGEVEYLLSFEDRWMTAGDFEHRKAAELLESLLQVSPDDFDAHHRKCQVECFGLLLDHVYCVKEKRTADNTACFLVKWKVCWTPKSMAACSEDWLQRSTKEHRASSRRSIRLNHPSKWAVQTAYYERLMQVITLDEGV